MDNAQHNPEPERYILLVAALIALLAGLWFGLIRMGWALPIFGRPDLTIQHGPLMIAGFLGVLIPIERAVAVETRFAFLVPLFTAIGMALLVVPDLSPGWGRGMITLASAGYVVLFLYFVSLDPRLELARTMKLGKLETWLFGGISTLLTIGLVWMSFLPGVGFASYTASAGLILIGGWLLIAGPARHTIRLPGRHRFIAACLMIGYVWLMAAGMFLLLFSWEPAGPVYDAILHAVFLGFVFL